MYLFFGIFLFILICFAVLNVFRRRHIIRKVCRMDCREKTCLLNEVLSPFGFCYDPCEDIFVSDVNAWQKKFGYQSLYDRSAPHFNMVFDCEPVYFDYDGRTWLIEFWKGQYGVNTGGEIGVYRADRIVPPASYETTVFHGLPQEELFPVRIALRKHRECLFTLRQKHWWLAGFDTGVFSYPEELTMTVSVLFPSTGMMCAFLNSLRRLNYSEREIDVCEHTVTIHFSTPKSCQPRLAFPLFAAFSQWKNRLFVRLYRFVTRPFQCTRDRVLYLYFYLPFVFRKTLRIRRYKK